MTSSQRFIEHPHPPRLRLLFELGPVRIDLPFVIGVMSDLSGNKESGEYVDEVRAQACGKIQGRQFLEFTKDNFNERMKAIRPRIVCQVKQVLSGKAGEALRVELVIESMDDFAPDRIAEKIEPLDKLVSTRTALKNMPLERNEVMKQANDFIEEIDRRLTDQVNEIIHASEFQKLEAAWRGLHDLVFNWQSDNKLKFKVLNISKSELQETFESYPGDSWDQNPLYRQLYCGLDSPGEEPFGCLIGDYYFDHSAPDILVLKGMARIAAGVHAPFISGASPRLLGLTNWIELHDIRRVAEIFDLDEYAAWRSFREQPDSRFVALAMPRFLRRLPWGKDNPVQSFNFEERVDAERPETFTWVNAAYAAAANIARSFKIYGWLSCIRGVQSGGMISNLPVLRAKAPRSEHAQFGPVEVDIPDPQEYELALAGLMPLCNVRKADSAVFLSTNSVQNIDENRWLEATFEAKISANLAYLLPCCRFMHYLLCIARATHRSLQKASDIELSLNDWLANYITVDPHASLQMKARYPLSAARVTVTEIPGRPGEYKLEVSLRPAYLLESPVDMRLVAQFSLFSKGSEPCSDPLGSS